MIIGLIGQKRVGKDTVAGMLKNIDIDTNFTCMALADPIKDIARLIFNFTEAQLYDDEKDIIDSRWGIKPRDFFEQFGTNIMQFDIYRYLPSLEKQVAKRLFWVHSLLSKIKDSNDTNNTNNTNEKNIIITDIRGLHELLEINKFAEGKAIFIRIIKEQLKDKEINKDTNINLHITQTEPNEIPNEYIFDTIVNNGSLKDLQLKVEKVYNKIINYN